MYNILNVYNDSGDLNENSKTPVCNFKCHTLPEKHNLFHPVPHSSKIVTYLHIWQCNKFSFSHKIIKSAVWWTLISTASNWMLIITKGTWFQQHIHWWVLPEPYSNIHLKSSKLCRGVVLTYLFKLNLKYWILLISLSSRLKRYTFSFNDSTMYIYIKPFHM